MSSSFNHPVCKQIIPDDGGSTHLWNVGRQSFYTAVQPRRQLWTSDCMLFMKPQCSLPCSLIFFSLYSHYWMSRSYTPLPPPPSASMACRGTALLLLPLFSLERQMSQTEGMAC
jgi:hypothetical protein